MTLRKWIGKAALCAAAAGAAVGCSESGKVHYLGDADLKYYRGKATRIDYANVCNVPARDAVLTEEPRTLADPRKDAIYDLTLVEALHTALSNNKIIRTAGQFLSPGNALYSNPNATSSVYDPAIQDSGVLFGGRGVEAALADFDTTFSTGVLWGRDERSQNVAASPYGPGFTLHTDTAAFTSRLQKQTAYGGIIGLSHNWNYLYSNSTGSLFPSSYTGQLSLDYRQPLWAGAGVEYTRIAGPANAAFSAITGVSQGVLIARINSDISIADFEAQVRNMLKDVEDNYWDLYLAYRNYDTLVTARNSALRTWREEKLKLSVGKGDPADEAQARDQYFEARTQVNRALSGDNSTASAGLGIYAIESRLRRMMGLPVNDGRILRPIDEPVAAEFVTDFRDSLAEALTKRVELRRQKWNIKSLELQLVAAKSLTNPRFDFVSQYRRNGFGDDLTGGTDDGVTPLGLHSAYGSLANGNQDGWNLGFEFSMPLGFRSANAQVRNIELRLAKAREVLSVQELEISHELAASIQTVTHTFANTKTSFNRHLAAEERVRLFSERERVGTVTTDLVLRAQASLAQADIAYFGALVSYTKSITDYYFRRGTLLEHNNVRLAEDRWAPAAYREALRRAWARSHALPNPLLGTEPSEFASPRPYAPRLPAGGDADLAPPDGPIPPPPEPRPLDGERGNGPLALPPLPPEEPMPRDANPTTSRGTRSARERRLARDDGFVERPRSSTAPAPERVRTIGGRAIDDDLESVSPGVRRLAPQPDRRFDDADWTSRSDDDMTSRRRRSEAPARLPDSERRFPSALSERTGSSSRPPKRFDETSDDLDAIPSRPIRPLGRLFGTGGAKDESMDEE